MAARPAPPSLLTAALKNAVAEPAFVTFASDDGRTNLEAYLFVPPAPRVPGHPSYGRLPALGADGVVLGLRMMNDERRRALLGHQLEGARQLHPQR